MSYILSSGTVTLPEEFNQQQLELNLGVREVDDVIVFGQIVDCETEEPIEGAIVKYFIESPFTGELVDVCHTFAGCDGYYMIRIPSSIEIINPMTGELEEVDLSGETITVMAVGSDCPDTLEPCECPINDLNEA